MRPCPREIALIVPVYNEGALLETSLPSILAQVRQDAPEAIVRLVAVDDGSRDGTREALARLAQAEPGLVYASFTRNFGKEAAIQAGLQLALERTQAQVLVVMDADLQHPPQLVAALLAHWRDGLSVAEAVKRARPADEGGVRRVAAGLFYGAFSRFAGLQLDQDTDFKLLDRQIAQAVVQLHERGRFFRGIVRWLGHPSGRVEFDVPERAGGQSGWSLLGLAGYAWRNLTSFSSAPLRLVTGLGGAGLVMGLVLGGKALADKIDGRALDGFSTVILLQIVFSSLILISLGIIGSYIARIYDEIKQRPHYVLRPEDTVPAGGRAP